MGCLCKRQPLHASQPPLRFGCLRYVLCALPLINRGAFGLLPHDDALLKVYRLRLSARYGRRLPKRIRLVQLHRVSACLAALTPDVFRSPSPMLDKSLGNAYGSPAHTHSLLDICTAQAACRTSLAPQANLPAVGRLRKPPLPRYGSPLRAKYRLRSSRGKDIRTTLPPICGTFHSCSAPAIMPKPTTCLFGQRSVRRCAPHELIMSHPQPPMWAAFRTGSAWRR